MVEVICTITSTHHFKKRPKIEILFRKTIDQNSKVSGSMSNTFQINKCMADSAMPVYHGGQPFPVFDMISPLFPSPIPITTIPFPDPIGEKKRQIAQIFGENTIRDDFNQVQIENFIATYCICNQPEIQETWMMQSQNCYQSQFYDVGNGQYFGMESEAAMKQKEDLYYKLLENYKYERITTYDSNKEKEVVILKCKYDGCDKILNKPWNMLDHMREHEGVKPHICDWCGKTFTQRGNLKKHCRQHIHPDVNHRKRFRCRLCEKGYTERYNLKAHMRKKHNR